MTTSYHNANINLQCINLNTYSNLIILTKEMPCKIMTTSQVDNTTCMTHRNLKNDNLILYHRTKTGRNMLINLDEKHIGIKVPKLCHEEMNFEGSLAPCKSH